MGVAHEVELVDVVAHLIVVVIVLAGKLKVDDDVALAILHHAVGTHAGDDAFVVAVEDITLVVQRVAAREPVGGLGVGEGMTHKVRGLALKGGVEEAVAHHRTDGLRCIGSGAY